MPLRTLRLDTSWGDLTLAGGSRAGEATVVLLPQLRLALDAGRPCRSLPAMTTVCLSHGHVDHLGGLAAWASQRALNSLGPARVAAPAAIAPSIRGLLDLHASMEGIRGYEVEVLSVSDGSRLDLRPDIRVEFFDTDHVVPSLGVQLVWVRHRRKAALADTPPEEIARRRLAGEEVTDPVEVALLASTGDTGPGVFGRPERLDAEVLLTECSFFGPEERDRARRYGHLHLEDLVEAAPQLRCRHLVLLHPSRRHSVRAAVAAVRSRLEPLLETQLHHLMVDWD